MSQNVSNLCPECGNSDLISDISRGEIICRIFYPKGLFETPNQVTIIITRE